MPNTTHTTTNPAYIGRGNILDPFVNYPDFPNTNAILQPRKATFSVTTLGSSQKSYHGSKADIKAIADWAITKAMSYNIEELPNQVFKIDITVPYDEITNEDDTAAEVSQWEINPTAVARNIFDSGIFFVQSNGQLSTQRYTIPPVLQAAVLKAIKENGSLKKLADITDLSADQIALYTKYAGITEQFYNLIKSGITSVQSYTMTVRRQSVYSVYNPKAFDDLPLVQGIQDATMNPIISDADLANYWNMDTETAKFLQKSYSRFKTSTAQADPFDMFVLGGYLVKRPTRQFVTPTKVQITQEFIFDEWSDNIYNRFSPIGHFPLVANTPYPP